MVERELPTTSGLDPCRYFRETRVYGRRTDGRTTDDEHLRHDSSSADKVEFVRISLKSFVFKVTGR